MLVLNIFAKLVRFLKIIWLKELFFCKKRKRKTSKNIFWLEYFRYSKNIFKLQLYNTKNFLNEISTNYDEGYFARNG